MAEEEEEEESLYCQRPLDPTVSSSSMVVIIRESPIFAKDDRLVFPPVNHENLQLESSELDNSYLLESPPSESESPSSSSSSIGGSASSFSFPSDSDGQPPLSPCESSPPPPPPPRKFFSYREADDAILQHWWELLLVRAYSKFKNLMTWLSTTLRPSFYPLLAVAVVWWWMRVRARRRRRVDGETRGGRLLRDAAIKEKDERIVQLLHQIAQMNELLLIKHHHKETVSS